MRTVQFSFIIGRTLRSIITCKKPSPPKRLYACVRDIKGRADSCLIDLTLMNLTLVKLAE